MAHPLKELMVEGLNAALHNRPVETIAVNPAVADVAASQSKIGWSQLLKGRVISKLWATTQDKYLGTSATVKANGAQWIIQLIETILIEWKKMWKMRNEDRNG